MPCPAEPGSSISTSTRSSDCRRRNERLPSYRLVDRNIVRAGSSDREALTAVTGGGSAVNSGTVFIAPKPLKAQGLGFGEVYQRGNAREVSRKEPAAAEVLARPAASAGGREDLQRSAGRRVVPVHAAEAIVAGSGLDLTRLQAAAPERAAADRRQAPISRRGLSGPRAKPGRGSTGATARPLRHHAGRQIDTTAAERRSGNHGARRRIPIPSGNGEYQGGDGGVDHALAEARPLEETALRAWSPPR